MATTFISSVGWSSSTLTKHDKPKLHQLFEQDPSFWNRSPGTKVASSRACCAWVCGSKRYWDNGRKQHQQVTRINRHLSALLNYKSSMLLDESDKIAELDFLFSWSRFPLLFNFLSFSFIYFLQLLNIPLDS